MAGVYIDMSNKNALCTISMLSSMIEAKPNGYLDILTPFVLNCIPTVIGDTVSVDDVTNKMQKEYGFTGFPRGLTEKILRYLSRSKGNNIQYIDRIRMQGKVNYSILQRYDNREFVETRDRMRQQISEILKELQRYLCNNFYHKELSFDELREKLIYFFEENGLTVIRNTEDLKQVTDKSGRDLFAIARFILEEYEKKSLTYTYLCNVTKGFLTYKAVYIISEDGKTDFGSQLKDVTFYLDCSLLLDALGYDTKSDQNAVYELIRLIRRAGGRVSVFQHTVDEAANLIIAFANNQDKRNNFRLDGLALKKYTNEMLLTLARTVADDLKKTTQIQTEEAPSFSDRSNYVNVLGEQDIIGWLSQCRNRPDSNANALNERFQYDARSLLAIGMCRRGSHPRTIERAKAVLVTQDPWLSKCLDSLYGDALKSEFSYTISDIDLVSLLWLREYDKESNLPSDLLIANANAACEVSTEVITRAIEIAEELEKAGEVPVERALLIRSHTELKPIIADTTQNDISLLSAVSVEQAIQKYISVISEESISLARTEEQEKANQERTWLIEQHRKSEAAHAEIKRMDDKEKGMLLERIKADKEKERRKQDKQLERANNQAKDLAQKCCKWLNRLLNIGGLLIMVIVTALCAYSFYISYKSEKSFWIPLIIEAFSLAGTISLIASPKSFLRRKIKKYGDHIYEKEYSKAVELIVMEEEQIEN